MATDTEKSGIETRKKAIHITLEEIHVSQRIRKLIDWGAIFKKCEYKLDRETGRNYYELTFEKDQEMIAIESSRPYPYPPTVESKLLELSGAE